MTRTLNDQIAPCAVEVITEQDDPDGEPDGRCQIAYDHDGQTRLVDIGHWHRLDHLPVGTIVDLTVQARRARDLRIPLASSTTPVRLTRQPSDQATVRVEGDTWAYTATIYGGRADTESRR